MKQKLIITLWKAQLIKPLPNDSIYCLLTYNNISKTSKQIPSKTSLDWKQTFIFSLPKEQLSLSIDFISLKNNQEIHFAHDNLAQTLSLAKASIKIPVTAPTKGSLPAKLDVIDQQTRENIGKVFIEYQVLKTQVTYIVQKIIDYNYLLKLTNFTVTFLRQLKKVPTFYLKLKYGQKTHREEFPFQQQNEKFTYAYPIKLHMNKELDISIELEVKQFFGLDYQSAHDSMKSGSISQRRSDMSTLRKKDTMIEIGIDSKISGLFELGFKENTKASKKIALTTVMKNKNIQIGSIQFQVQAIFKTQQEKQALQEQKKGITQKNNPQIQTERKKKPSNAPNLQQSNGVILLNTIMGKLQIGPQLSEKIQGKDLSLILKLGKQTQQSSVLQNPGKQLIFLDTFTFKRTWQQTIKLIVQIHDPKGIKIPTFNASVNLRQLFQTSRVHSKKIKIFDEQKNYSGTFTLDMEYKQQQKKQKQGSGSKEKKQSRQKMMQRKSIQKREKIAERMRQREEEKKNKIDNSRLIGLNKDREIVTMAQALDLRDLILPPLRSRKANSQVSKQLRYSTLSPVNNNNNNNEQSLIKRQKYRGANVYNSNGGIKFSRSPRFSQNYNSQDNNKSGSSYSLIRESDFDIKKKRGTFIGYGEKYDFTKDFKQSPGIGKYQIPSLWDKYH